MSGYTLGTLMLAAGQSRRFDGIKQLATLQQSSMLQQALEKLSGIDCDCRVVTLGANKATIESAINLPANIFVKTVSDWQNGISASIKSGLEALEHCSHVLILLADQPDISAHQIEQLISLSRSNPKQIICAHYAGKNAVPAIFPASDYALLHSLQGDMGAGKHLNSPKYKENVIPVALQSGATDIDTLQDLSLWQKQQKVNL
ncbi:nucleotidyltransferase family protein [Planctobacterium marinum]|uniref:nucleotidyltransferase family protein n=1 Tax=Planctobacterium marinum TaxID=1631968 RepID=UPI001E4A1F7A|nr:nucleotidyltransferase family protein [Planctobacterium marinum]MCC2603865.1 nucleotidyltransferase family protein [Planctobacterium marinum]